MNNHLPLSAEVVWPEEGFAAMEELRQFIAQNFPPCVKLSELWEECRKMYPIADNEMNRLHFQMAMDEGLFFGRLKKKEPVYISGNSMFTGASFLVTPNKTEIKHRILLIEERFFPYINPNFYSSEISVYDESKKLNLSWFELSGTFFDHLNPLISYHKCYSEELNRRLGFEDFMTITSLDMREFFAKHDFNSGDALLFTVRSYLNAELSVRILKKREFFALQKEYSQTCNRICEDILAHLDQGGETEQPSKMLLDSLTRLQEKENFPKNHLPCWSEFFSENPHLQTFFFFGDLHLFRKKDDLNTVAREILAREHEKLKVFPEGLGDLATVYRSVCNEDFLQLKLLVEKNPGLFENPQEVSEYAEKIIDEYFPDSRKENSENIETLRTLILDAIDYHREFEHRITKETSKAIAQTLRIFKRIVQIYFRVIENPETGFSEERVMNLISLKINLEDTLFNFASNPYEERHIQEQSVELEEVAEYVSKSFIAPPAN